jgi:hypothetical protein
MPKQRTRTTYYGDRVYSIALDEQPAVQNGAAKIYDALNAVSAFQKTAGDAMTDARQLLYGWGEDGDPEDFDREALTDLARRGRAGFDALCKALGADAEHTTEHGGPNLSEAPTTADRSGREAFASDPGARPTVDSRHGYGRVRQFHDFNAIFGLTPRRNTDSERRNRSFSEIFGSAH